MAIAQIMRRVVKAMGVPGIALAIVVVGLTGGAVSGWLEHGPSSSAGPPPSPTTSVPSTTSTTALDALGQVKADIVDDLGIDLTSQDLDPDLVHRRALAVTPNAVATRHGLIEQAWASDQVARIEADYDSLVVEHASNPTVPSVTGARFVVTDWQAVSVAGTSARAVVLGHFVLHEPGNVAARAVGGYVAVFDRTWTVAVTLSGGTWKLEGRSAA